MCIEEAWASDERAVEALRRLGIKVRPGAPYLAVLGRDRDILAALRTRDEVIFGISPPGVDAKLAVASLDVLGAVLRSGRCGVVEVPRLAAASGRARLTAVNEIAVFPRRSATLMSYSVRVGGVHLFSDVADGVLVATPLGSTAYARSAGGPVMLLGTRAVEIVPVNSTSRRPPAVAPLEAEVEIADIYSASPAEVIADGAARVAAESDVRIKADRPAKLLRLVPANTSREPGRLPPSAKFVLKILRDRGPATASALSASTGLSARTVQHALRILRERGLVEAVVEAGRRVYRVKE